MYEAMWSDQIKRMCVSLMQLCVTMTFNTTGRVSFTSWVQTDWYWFKYSLPSIQLWQSRQRGMKQLDVGINLWSCHDVVIESLRIAFWTLHSWFLSDSVFDERHLHRQWQSSQKSAVLRVYMDRELERQCESRTWIELASIHHDTAWSESWVQCTLHHWFCIRFTDTMY